MKIYEINDMGSGHPITITRIFNHPVAIVTKMLWVLRQKTEYGDNQMQIHIATSYYYNMAFTQTVIVDIY